MKVYVLTSSCLNVDGGDCEHWVVGAFATFEQAQNAMAQEIKGARTDFEGVDCEEDHYVEGDVSWSIREKGCYMSHHFDIKITEIEVQ